MIFNEISLKICQKNHFELGADQPTKLSAEDAEILSSAESGEEL